MHNTPGKSTPNGQGIKKQGNATLMKRYGKSYYLATLFFPRKLAYDTMELYRFVRIPDQVVDGDELDNEGDNTSNNKHNNKQEKIFDTSHYAQANKSLGIIFAQRSTAYHNNEKKDLTRGQSVSLFYRKHIPFTYSKAFFDAMILDTTLHRYETYKQLQGYMYGSAEVVGLMMCYLIGCDRKALPYAQLLGEAMQMSNFLRDIDEDYTDLGRIYMPSQELQKFGLTHDDVITFCRTKIIDERFVAFMKYRIERVRGYYAESLQGIHYLHPQGRKAVYLAAKLYEGILDRIESHHYNVFRFSCRTTKWDKLKLLIKGLWSYMYWKM